MTDTDSLIAALGREARPVRRLRTPMLRSAAWLAFAFGVIALLVLHDGLADDLAQSLGQRKFVLDLLGALGTGIGATIAAFHLSMPGRSWRWAFLPVPGLALWLFGMGYGCWADWVRLGPGAMRLGMAVDCFCFIALTAVPLSAAMLFLLRYAAPIRPVPTAILATLSVASLAAGGHSLVDGLGTTLMVLVWHLGTTALLVLAARIAGPPLLRLLYEPPAGS